MDTKEKTNRARTGQRPPGKGSRGATATAKGTRTKPQPKRAPSRATPDVVYTQPGPFKRDRFLLQLLTVLAIVLALVFGMAIFFKVGKADTGKKGEQIGNVFVSGTEKYTPYDVVQASGIKPGTSLLTLRETEIGGRIMEQLPYITKVRVRIKLPDAVNIEVEESDVVYSVEADDGNWWLIRSDGIVVERTNGADAEQFTTIVGVKLAQPQVGQQAVAYEPTQEEKPEEGTSEKEDTEDAADAVIKPVTVLASDQLRAAISIIELLEDHSIIGKVSKVDVTGMNNLHLWYDDDRYQVILGDSTRLNEKIGIMKATVNKMEDYESGVLDISFTVLDDQVVYTPFQ